MKKLELEKAKLFNGVRNGYASVHNALFSNATNVVKIDLTFQLHKILILLDRIGVSTILGL